MIWLLVLTGVLIGFAVSSVVLAQREHPRAVRTPFIAAWALGMAALSLLGADFTLRDRTFIEQAFDQFYASLWLAIPLVSAALVTRRFQPGGDIMNTVFGAIAAGYFGVVLGTAFLATVSCVRGLGCL
jgi:high-affinity Fe2+/Pb2+ permease